MTGRSNRPSKWISCQLGAREHYAIPRAVLRDGRLQLLVTDAWAPPGSLCARLPGGVGRRIRERFVAELHGAHVRSFTASLIAHEASWRMRGLAGWELVVTRNEWFQRRAANEVRLAPVEPGATTVVFAHSYAARAQFQAAKARGFVTILGQIDPGEGHFQTVERLAREWPDYGAVPERPPAGYFESWREECALADRIVVNSEWSGDALARAGIPPSKVTVVPLPFEPESVSSGFSRDYPEAFTASRPLRVLCVGSATVAKGVPPLLEALDRSEGLPIELTLVGEQAMVIPPRYRAHPSIQWVGPVSRSDVMTHYRQSDVLVFPSFSDGFGMAQIEAQGWRLPVIASRSCGRVVEDGVNGLLLDDVSPATIASALRKVTADPRILAGFSRNAGSIRPAGLSPLGAALHALEPA